MINPVILRGKCPHILHTQCEEYSRSTNTRRKVQYSRRTREDGGIPEFCRRFRLESGIKYVPRILYEHNSRDPFALMPNISGHPNFRWYSELPRDDGLSVIIVSVVHVFIKILPRIISRPMVVVILQML